MYIRTLEIVVVSTLCAEIRVRGRTTRLVAHPLEMSLLTRLVVAVSKGIRR